MCVIKLKTNNKAKCERQKEIFSNPQVYPYYKSKPHYGYSGKIDNKMADIYFVSKNDKDEVFYQLFTPYVRRPEVSIIVDALNANLDKNDELYLKDRELQ